MTLWRMTIIYCNGKDCDEEFQANAVESDVFRKHAADTGWTCRKSTNLDYCPHCSTTINAT